jgi:hypothetical protein
VKTAKEMIEEAAKAANEAVGLLEAENGFNRIERLAIRNGVKADMLECSLKLMYNQALFELAGMKRRVAELEAHLGTDEPRDDFEREIDVRDRARDMNAALR